MLPSLSSLELPLTSSRLPQIALRSFVTDETKRRRGWEFPSLSRHIQRYRSRKDTDDPPKGTSLIFLSNLSVLLILGF
ncbi:hypothetical protein M6B38_376800 [Iris pallida]|uniref:Uncharacterized protein n=1 Tax=Iris pallida TaxID=29817 RepID=A0AAX6GA88_IRIPA|nr:hypothetical protein M6B38_376800 [Iris pallida]